MIIEQIKTASMAARKARDSSAAASLSTLLGEIETLAKGGKGELTDAIVITVVKKFIKNIDETLKHVTRAAGLEALTKERSMYEQFLPKQLSEQELSALIESIGGTNVGDTMKELKINHAGTYDGALASKILKAKFK